MQGSSFQRARRFGQAQGSRWVVYLAGALSALLTPLLLIVLGLIVQLLVSRGSEEVPRDRVLGPWVQGRIVDWPPGEQAEYSLLVLVGTGLAIAVLQSLSLVWFYRLVEQTTLRAAAQLQEAIHRQSFRLGPTDLLRPGRSRPEELFNEQTERVRQGLAAWWLAVPRSIVALAALLLLAVAVNFWLTLLALLLAAFIWQQYLALRDRSERRCRLWHDRAKQHYARLLEDLRLAPLAAGYSLDHRAGQEFEESMRQYQVAAVRAASGRVTRKPLLLLIVFIGIAFLLLVVGLSPGVTVAGSVVLGTALICAYFPAERLYQLRSQLEQPDRAAAEIWAFLDREPSVGQIPEARPLDRLQREIRLENVTLADRNGGKLLDHVSLTIPATHRVAVLASDPQTPMAVAGLFVRFYDPAAGQILFDGHDLRRATLDTVRGQALLVPGDGLLFTGTVWENINCSDSAFTTLQVSDAAKQALAYEFIQELPQGMSTVIGQHGLPLTASQAFRVGLARALLHEPSLLVVEEPREELEGDGAAQLDQALQRAADRRTVILLPARLATLRAADRIYLFHEAKLHAQGKHAELLQSCELYRHLNYLRYNPFRKAGL